MIASVTRHTLTCARSDNANSTSHPILSPDLARQRAAGSDPNHVRERNHAKRTSLADRALHATQPAAAAQRPSSTQSSNTPPDHTNVAWDPSLSDEQIATAAHIVTPLLPLAWRHELRHHPDPAHVRLLVHGLRNGVDVHYRGPRPSACKMSTNQKSTLESASEVAADIAAEVKAGRKAGPFSSPPLTGFFASPLGAVRKKNGKLRIVHNLSWPIGASVNSKIEDLHCVLSSFDAAMDLLVAQGKGTMLSKIDIASAYKCIPVRPADFALLGLHWEGKFYFDKTLPFGLSSSCAIWERYATAAEWAVLHNTSIKRLCHYIDDFLLISDEKAAANELKQLLDLFRRLGLPVSMEKLEGPIHSLLFLGIQVDSLAMTASLGSDRLSQLQAQAGRWASRPSCSRRELQSWAGLLSFAAKVVRPGRTFTRHAFALLSATHHMRPSARISLSTGFTSDMRWWRDFLPAWNGVGLLYDVAWSSSATLQLWTDASTVGYGAVFQRQWFACAWTDEERTRATAAKQESMPWMELYCIVRAAATWGQHWRGKKVTFHCDAMTVVGAVHARTSAAEPIMQLLRSLFFVSAVCGFEFRVLHTPGITNTLADPLSRLQIELFKQRCPDAALYPTIPSAVPTPSF